MAKSVISVSLDTEVIEWIDQKPARRSTLINALLRHYMDADRDENERVDDHVQQRE